MVAAVADIDQARHARDALIDKQLHDPEYIRAELGRRHLRDFIPGMWPIIEPVTPYADNWSTHAVCEHAEAIYYGDIQNLLVLEPPRIGKSLCISVAFPAWCWIKAPSMRFVCASYIATLAIDHSVKCREVVESPWYECHYRRGPEPEAWALKGDQNEKVRYDTTHTGFRIAVGVDGLATGQGGDILIVDDAHSMREIESSTKREAVITWWRVVMPTRLNDPNSGGRIIVAQRGHVNDLPGHVMAQMAADEGYPQFTVLTLPHEFDVKRKCITHWTRRDPDPRSPRREIETEVRWEDPRTEEGELLWPTRFGERVLAGLKKELGERASAAQFQQLPTVKGGDLLKWEWFEVVDELPPESEWIRDVRGWDLAATDKATSDHTGGGRVIRTRSHWYIVHAVKFKATPGPTEDSIKSTASQDGKGTTVVIEQEGGSGGPITLHHYSSVVLPEFTVKGSPARGSKWERNRTMASKAENRLVRVLRGASNPILQEAVESFGPGGDSPDVMDGLTHAFNETLEENESWTGVVASG